MAPITEKGSVLVLVLALLGLTSLAVVHAGQVQQQQVQETVRQIQLAELHVYASTVLRHAGIMLEQGHTNTTSWSDAWQLPSAIQVHIELQQSQCPNQQPGCYQVHLTLEGRGGVRLERSRKYWAEAGCGQHWEWPK